MTLVGSLNKDVAPDTDGCGSRLFIWSRDIPPIPPPPPPPPSAPPGCTSEVLGPAAATPSPLSPRGVCCSILMTKERSGSKKSLSYTHLFKKSQLHNAGSGSPQESSESWGMSQWQKRETTTLFYFWSLKQEPPGFRAPFFLQPKSRPASCISMGLFLRNTVISLLFFL